MKLKLQTSLILAMKESGITVPTAKGPLLYIAALGNEATVRAMALCETMQKQGLAAQTDVMGRSLKAQMKYANKIGALYTIVVGDNELETGKAQLKDMQTGEQTEIDLDDSLYTVLYNKSLDRQLAGMTELLNEEILGGMA